MGIYDRDYVRDRRPQGGGGGFGGPPGGGRYWSGRTAVDRFKPSRVNTWLIVINVAVFLLGLLLLSVEVPVYRGAEFIEDLPAEVRERAQPAGDLQPAVNAPGGRTLTAVQPMVDPENDRIVGRAFWFVMDPIRAFGHFSTHMGFLRFEVWRLITFQFLHADLIHLLFNMIGLYFFGPRVEEQLGSKRYAAFYLTCGIAGGLLYLILNLLGTFGVPLPGTLDVGTTTPLIGASAGVFGVIMARAYIDPDVLVQLLFPPIITRIKTIAYVFVGLATLNLLFGNELKQVPLLNFFFRGNQGGDAAHIGGAIAGYYFVRRPHLLREFFDVLGNSRLPDGKRRPAGKARPLRHGPRAGGAMTEAEIDTILDKVKRGGRESLTESEIRALERYSRDNA